MKTINKTAAESVKPEAVTEAAKAENAMLSAICNLYEIAVGSKSGKSRSVRNAVPAEAWSSKAIKQNAIKNAARFAVEVGKASCIEEIMTDRARKEALSAIADEISKAYCKEAGKPVVHINGKRLFGLLSLMFQRKTVDGVNGSATSVIVVKSGSTVLHTIEAELQSVWTGNADFLQSIAASAAAEKQLLNIETKEANAARKAAEKAAAEAAAAEKAADEKAAAEAKKTEEKPAEGKKKSKKAKPAAEAEAAVLAAMVLDEGKTADDITAA